MYRIKAKFTSFSSRYKSADKRAKPEMHFAVFEGKSDEIFAVGTMRCLSVPQQQSTRLVSSNRHLNSLFAVFAVCEQRSWQLNKAAWRWKLSCGWYSPDV